MRSEDSKDRESHEHSASSRSSGDDWFLSLPSEERGQKQRSGRGGKSADAQENILPFGAPTDSLGPLRAGNRAAALTFPDLTRNNASHAQKKEEPYSSVVTADSQEEGHSSSSDTARKTRKTRRRGARPRHQRSKRCLHPLWWSSPFVLLACVGAIFLIGLPGWSAVTLKQFHDGNFDGAQAQYEAQQKLTQFGPERWVGDFNTGTTLLRQGKTDEGIQLLHRAWEYVPRAREIEPGKIETYSYECQVRLNLALGLEILGDVASAENTWPQALSYYEESENIIGPCRDGDADAPESGQSDSGDGDEQDSSQSEESHQSGRQSNGRDDRQPDESEDIGQQAERSHSRLQEKKQRAQRQGADGEDESFNSGESSGDELSEAQQPQTEEAPEPETQPRQRDPWAGETQEEKRRREELQWQLQQGRQQSEQNEDMRRYKGSYGAW